MRLRIPPAEVHAAEELEQALGFDAATPRDSVLAVGRERHVVGVQGATRSDLGRFLSQQGSPDSQLALPLKRGCLGVEAANEGQVAVEAAQFVFGDLERVVGVLESLPLGGQQLHQVTRAVLSSAVVGRHACHSSCSPT